MTTEQPAFSQHSSSKLALFNDWTRLDGATQRSNCQRGTVVYAAGDPSDCVFLLKSGAVKIVRSGPDDKRLIAHLVGPGEIFGEMVLLGETPRADSAEVLEDGALWSIPRKAVLEWLRLHPETWQAVAALLGWRLRSLEDAVERMLFCDAEQRVVWLLLELARQYGVPVENGVDLKIELSQKELAHLIGSTRETTSSILNRLRKQGLIRIRRRRLSICSLADLSRAAHLPPKRPPEAERPGRAAAVRSAAGESV